MKDDIRKRKEDHIKIVLTRDVVGKHVTTGLERYRFLHNALPEISFDDVSLAWRFGPTGQPLKAPFLISSMTGGSTGGERVNRNLAMAAQERGWAMGLGSLRVALERPESRESFRVRKWAPKIPLLANLGLVQLNSGFGVEDCRRAVEMVEADALVFHLNSLQEVFQPGGDTDFRGLLKKLEAVCRAMTVPVGVKEVGMGIDGRLARKLVDAGVSFIDVAGAGGTSWIRVEKYRQGDSLLSAAADAFDGWGIPTAESVKSVRRQAPGTFLIASGGLGTGVDAAKTLALGADLAGFARTLLGPARSGGPEAVMNRMKQIELECRIAMFGIGVKTVEQLKNSDRLVNVDESGSQPPF
ncbi:type 2 isopentenyl-diphosphate Delta-isomerase [Staphylospora marina]|uniref:type 2 isopentenyl-diphosphate Delta-isomerase n=1 Tax=Staphylospora marina TaxID=2490858 RepID=UPI000F5BD118|nr:type 2 isopentenyl-diphosphate Delta-isomerase [Staphylospora marina]